MSSHALLSCNRDGVPVPADGLLVFVHQMSSIVHTNFGFLEGANEIFVVTSH